jgi:iron(III) transport system ATP-binding protein
MQALLEASNLAKQYTAGGLPVVHDVGFRVERGEVFVLLGPSGCGKTTTLRMIAGFEPADRGEVRLDGILLEGPGVHMRPEKRDIGFIFQDYALFPHLTVLENVIYGLKSMSKSQRCDRGMELLELVGLADCRDRKPQELSGGEQQRIALARSMAPAPKLILMDEPFSNLDAALRSSTRAEVRDLLARQGMSAILVTHDQEEALSFADRIAVMNHGHIEQVGRPEQVYRRPQTTFVAQFLGRTNLLSVDAKGEIAHTPLGPIRLNRSMHGQGSVSIRPEHLQLDAPQPGFPRGRVLDRVYKGHDLSFTVQIDELIYEVHTDYRCTFQSGDDVRIVPIENAVVLEGTIQHPTEAVN